MNAARRKALLALQQRAEKLASDLADILSEAETLKEEIEDLKEEEENYYAAMPESLQNGDKGQAAEEAIRAMETACESLEELIQLDLSGIADELGNAQA